MAKIEQTLKKGGSLRLPMKQLARDTDRMYVIGDVRGDNTRNMDEVIEISERFYAVVYANGVRPGDSAERNHLVSEVRIVTKDAVEKALKLMKSGKLQAG